MGQFFLETHAVLKAIKGRVATLIMRFNTFTGGDSVVLDGTFQQVIVPLFALHCPDCFAASYANVEAFKISELLYF